MNKLFEFRNQINSKILIGFIIFIGIIIILFSFLFSKNNKIAIEKNNEANPYKCYTSADKKVSIELPKRYNLTEKQNDSSCLNLQSSDGLLINIQQETIVVGKSLKEVVSSDKNIFPKKFENFFDVSNLEEFNLDNGNSLTSYKYNFKFNNQSVDYFAQVFWIQGNTQYYIISIFIPQNNIINYQGIESEITSSFKFN